MKPRPEISSDRILELAHRKGLFVVSWRWRDDSLRRRCNKLVRRGLLQRVRRAPPGSDYYRPVSVFS